MPQITMRVSQNIYDILKSSASESNLSLTEFILSKAVPNYLKDSVTLNEVYDRISKVNVGKIFSMPSLFSATEWDNFSSGSRVAVGRNFKKAYNKNTDDLRKFVEYLGTNSANLAQYKRLK